MPRSGTAITNVTVIDAMNPIRLGQTVIFEGDEIVYVGTDSQAPAVRNEIDGTGKYLIPGLWDMHVHLTYNDALVDVMPESFLRYGITSVRDTGGLLHKLLPVVEKMRKPDVLAPRVFFSGPLLDGKDVVYDGANNIEIGVQNSDANQAARNVAALKAAGASFIKIYEMVSPDVFHALVAAANEHDLPIASHVPLSMLASAAAPSVGTMEHLRNIEMDCASNWQELHTTRLQLLKNDEGLAGAMLRGNMHNLQRGSAIEMINEERCSYVISKLLNTIQVPTLGLNTIPLTPMFERADWADALAQMPVSIQERWQGAPPWLPSDPADWDLVFPRFSMDMVRRLYEAGVPIGAGTDTPIGHAIPGYSLLHELEVLVQAGMNPADALAAATVQPAKFLRLTDQMGSINVGKQADLVLLNANPLDSIGNLHQIELVVAQGKRVPR